MKIVHNQVNQNQNSLNAIPGGKKLNNALAAGEKELLHLVAETFTLVTGGNFKKRKNIA